MACYPSGHGRWLVDDAGAMGGLEEVASAAPKHNVPETLRELYSIGDTVVGKSGKNKRRICDQSK